VRIVFLGTGTSQGVPIIACLCAVCNSTDTKDKRLRSSILIESNDTTVVIDSGPDFRQQMLTNRVKKLSGLLFTHEHKDHIAGMDDIRAFNYVNQCKVDVYATKQVEDSLRREFPYVFEDLKYPGVPEINLHRIEDRPFAVGDLDFIPMPVMHYRLPVTAFRVGGFSYVTDANHIPEKTFELMHGSDVLVINALRHEKHVSHFNLEEALQIIDRVNPSKAFLTHISHQLGKCVDVDALLPPHVRCAYDGLEIFVD
jgi:phosphoribosyl 1,2-cyclic phosphate phosphodiesterase